MNSRNVGDSRQPLEQFQGASGLPENAARCPLWTTLVHHHFEQKLSRLPYIECTTTILTTLETFSWGGEKPSQRPGESFGLGPCWQRSTSRPCHVLNHHAALLLPLLLLNLCTVLSHGPCFSHALSSLSHLDRRSGTYIRVHELQGDREPRAAVKSQEVDRKSEFQDWAQDVVGLDRLRLRSTFKAYSSSDVTLAKTPLFVLAVHLKSLKLYGTSKLKPVTGLTCDSATDGGFL